MKCTAKWAAALLFATAVFLSGCRLVSRMQARDLLNKGVKAFAEQKYEIAAMCFQKSIRLNPASDDARMYLAMTYASRFVPGSSDRNSLESAEKAIEAFKDLIVSSEARGKPNVTAMLGLVSLYYHLKRYDEAKYWCGRILQVDPGNRDVRVFCDSL